MGAGSQDPATVRRRLRDGGVARAPTESDPWSHPVQDPAAARRRLRDGGAALINGRQLRTPSAIGAPGPPTVLVASEGASRHAPRLVGEAPEGRRSRAARVPLGPPRAPAEPDEDDEDEEGLRGGGGDAQALRDRVLRLRRQMEVLQRATASLQTMSLHAQAAQAARMELDGDRQHDAADAHEALRDHPLGGFALDGEGDEDEADEAGEAGEAVHYGVSCDGCGAGPPLYGPVMTCIDCEDFDFCARCFNDHSRNRHPRGHRFLLRPPRDGPRHSLSNMLSHLFEEQMLHEAIRVSTQGDDAAAGSNEPQEDPEVRAAVAMSQMQRVPFDAPSRSAGADDQTEECALCLEEYQPGEEVLRTGCGHLFHENCLGPWLIKSLSCPMCKGNL